MATLTLLFPFRISYFPSASIHIHLGNMDAEKKDSFDVNHKKKCICWNGLSIVNWGPHFMSNKRLVAICWQGSLHILHQEEVQTELYAPLVYIIWPTTAGRPWFHLSTRGLRPALCSQNCTIWYLIYMRQTYLGTWAGIFTIKSALSFVENNSGCYLNLSPRLQLLFCSNKCFPFFITIQN